jgi:hypothetical protein
MGERQTARIAHEQKIAKLESEVAPIEVAKLREMSAEAEIDREIEKLAIKAAHGDRSALKQQRELRVRKDESHLQAENLERLAVPIRKAIAAAEGELPHFIRAELVERVADGIRELPGLTDELAKIIQPIAQAFGKFRSRLHEATAEALPLISRGDPERIRVLENRLRTAIVRGIRAQLSFEFRSEGLEILSVSEFEGKDFRCAVEPLLSSMISALEMDLRANGVATPGRAEYRAVTNIAGLFGVNVRFNEVVSLPVEHENTKKLVALGALEMIDTPEKTGDA